MTSLSSSSTSSVNLSTVSLDLITTPVSTTSVASTFSSNAAMQLAFGSQGALDTLAMGLIASIALMVGGIALL
ncbi:hypothetical protein BCV69DRAFT_279865 [Microstroma glucosiphilum]|uniref:Uncharacterized protein n=1 Tax=Pseudomicrostroma glucosiphilum TaxID=1684307 RepID=A0A316UFD2_9BASI|nr:hypothetical protein BCV69DRAFT_279865 [Pseudomicrostroma glucosiphilum]PWN23959.1 hypothetical protein BCV69DRAFT_279865 [Pseudomicrostroma glucosiphilum]